MSVKTDNQVNRRHPMGPVHAQHRVTENLHRVTPVELLPIAMFPCWASGAGCLAFLLPKAVRALRATGGHPRSISDIELCPGLLQPFA